jgi:hypothetical protein
VVSAPQVGLDRLVPWLSLGSLVGAGLLVRGHGGLAPLSAYRCPGWDGFTLKFAGQARPVPWNRPVTLVCPSTPLLVVPYQPLIPNNRRLLQRPAPFSPRRPPSSQVNRQPNTAHPAETRCQSAPPYGSVRRRDSRPSHRVQQTLTPRAVDDLRLHTLKCREHHARGVRSPKPPPLRHRTQTRSRLKIQRSSPVGHHQAPMAPRTLWLQRARKQMRTRTSSYSGRI